MQTQRIVIDFFIGVFASVLLITPLSSCKGPPHEEETLSYSYHVNNTITEQCRVYRTVTPEYQQEIKRSLTELMQNYHGRIDVDAEYCLNAMNIPHDN